MKERDWVAICFVAGLVAAPGLARAQTVQSQDSILPNASVNYGDAAGMEMADHQQVVAAETTVSASAAFMHTQYHENFPPGTGDDENGFTPGFGVGVGGLIPFPPMNADIYSNLSYNFDAGNITYGGHYLYSGLPALATDNAVFNRVELRLGMGLPLQNGWELIPFAAGGYQAWNRNINQKGIIGTDEFYRSGLLGAGLKLDVPAGPRWVVSATGEMLALMGGAVAFDSVGSDGVFGVTGEERVELGADYAATGRIHTFVTLYWEHFNYSGSKPSIKSLGFYEPLSTTTQFGANVGVAYSFY